MKLITFLLLIIVCLPVEAQLAPDKQLHVAFGAGLATWGTMAGRGMYWSDEEALAFGITTGVMCGIGKELWDGMLGGHAEIKDLEATIGGTLLGAGITYAFLKIFPVKHACIAVSFDPVLETPIINFSYKIKISK